MGTGWLPWSAASLASGAVLLVLGVLSLPPISNLDQVVLVIQGVDAFWLMGAVAFFVASVGLTMGLPAILWLIPERQRIAGLVGLWVWAFGMIGTNGLGAMLILFRATLRNVDLSKAEVGALTDDPALTAFVAAVLGAFYLGELIVAIVLLRSSAVAPWIPVLLLVHLATAPLNGLLPPDLQGVQTVALGVALMGIAVTASENWAHTRPVRPL